MDDLQRLFLTELGQVGYSMTRTPGGLEQCGCDYRNKLIYLGADAPEPYVWIAALHELGHANTLRNFFEPGLDEHEALVLCNLRRALDRHFKYAEELAAWSWAESRLVAGYEAEFQRLRTRALTTYLPKL